MKIQPLNLNNLIPCKTCKRNFKSAEIPFDSFEKIAFRGNNSEFIPAETAEEAIKYGIDNFGIGIYKGFSVDDVDVLNWLNEGLYRAKVIMGGNIVLPKKILYLNYTKDDDTVMEMTENGGFKLNKNYFNNYIKFIKSEILKSDSDDKTLQNLVIEAQKYDMSINGDIFVIKSPFSLIYHELGHIQHRNNIGSNMFKQISKSPKSSLSASAREYVDLFNKNKKTVAARVSKYATENVLEFVAETFTGLCEGVKYDDKVMELYRKLGGVEV